MKAVIMTALIAILGLAGGLTVSAQILRMPDIYSDNMVLQEHTQVELWGLIAPLSKVEVVASWSSDTLRTICNSYARWSVTLPTPGAGGPYTIWVSGAGQQIVIHNVAIGENWLCTGQSNMEFNASWRTMTDWRQDTAGANYPEIRFFHISNESANYPQVEVRGKWEVCTPSSMYGFSAVGYFFGRSLNQRLRVPIGLIESCWGGTPVEAWMPDSIFQSDSLLATSARILKPAPWCPMVPSVCFNAMIAPIVNFPVAGAIWYQGETNVANPGTYEQDFTRMISSWRTLWHKDFPFYFVQIAPYNYSSRDSGALLREAQMKTSIDLEGTGMVVTTDLVSDTNNIHPIDKLDVGNRLAAWALAKTYHLPGIAYSGPIYRSMQVVGDRIRVDFDFATYGLQVRGPEVTDVWIAGADRHFYPAKAVVHESVLVAYSPQVPHPVALRLGFFNTAMPDLFNKEGLPASPFRTDDWPVQ